MFYILTWWRNIRLFYTAFVLTIQKRSRFKPHSTLVTPLHFYNVSFYQLGNSFLTDSLAHYFLSIIKYYLYGSNSDNKRNIIYTLYINTFVLHFQCKDQFKDHLMILKTTRKPKAWRLVPLCHFFLIEKRHFTKSMSMCEKKLQSILKLFYYPRDCRGEIVWNTLLPVTNKLRYCFCDRSSKEVLKWALEFFGRKILNSVTDCGDKIIVP